MDYEELYKNAKAAFRNDQLDLAISLLESASEIKPSSEITLKIEKMKAVLKKREEEKESNKNDLEASITAIENLTIKSPTDDDYEKLYSESKKSFKTGEYQKSLQYLEKCYKINPTEVLQLKICKVKKFVPNNESGEKKAAQEEYTDDLNESIKKLENLSFNKEQLYSENMAKAKELFRDKNYQESLDCLELCFNLQPNQKLEEKIEKLKTFLVNESVSAVDSEDCVRIQERIVLNKKTHDKLYDYQKQGIKWLSNLHYTSPGGILADDMGLGKTVQISAFVLAVSNAIPRSSFMIVMPVSLISVWTNELLKWAPSLFCFTYQGAGSKQSLNKLLKKVQTNGGIVLTTYGTVTANACVFRHDLAKSPELMRSSKTPENSVYGPYHEYTYVILDEGHKIKNPAAKCTKALYSIEAKHRLVLTGTAVQNNLLELWSLYNFTHSGRLLGSQATFKREYSNAIELGRSKDAGPHEQHYGKLVAESLRKLISPYFLRRTKNEVLGKNNLKNNLEKMSRKDELVVWIYLTEIQENIYRDFLSSDEVKFLLMGEKKSPLVSLTILKKLCDHPRLLSEQQCEELNLESGCYNAQTRTLNPKQIMLESNKIKFAVELMDQLLKEDHKVLVFSLSLKLLDMLQIVLENLNLKREEREGPDCLIHKICRLDGRIKSTAERGELVDRFQTSDVYTSMFLTTQVGGVGLTLTSATRVIILDPSWNPAVDAQAVDRAYRIGQKRDVIVYRLITCSTVEEKIYRRQVFKQSIIRQTTGGTAKEDLNSYRYFSQSEIRDLFFLDVDVKQSPTRLQLDSLHEEQLRMKPKNDYFDTHVETLLRDFSEIINGVSHHDLLFSRIEKFDTANPEAMNQARMMAIQSEQKLSRENNEDFTKALNPRPQNRVELMKPDEFNNRNIFRTNQPTMMQQPNILKKLIQPKLNIPNLHAKNPDWKDFLSPKVTKKPDLRETPDLSRITMTKPIEVSDDESPVKTHAKSPSLLVDSPSSMNEDEVSEASNDQSLVISGEKSNSINKSDSVSSEDNSKVMHVEESADEHETEVEENGKLVIEESEDEFHSEKANEEFESEEEITSEYDDIQPEEDKENIENLLREKFSSITNKEHYTSIDGDEEGSNKEDSEDNFESPTKFDISRNLTAQEDTSINNILKSPAVRKSIYRYLSAD